MHTNRKTYMDTVAYKYALKVVNREIVAGKYIILECERFLSDLARQDDDDFLWKFDLQIYEIVVGFQEFFTFADGINAGKKMKLAEFQEWILCSIFCWVHKEEGYVRFSKSYIQVARKQGKDLPL
ncbi:MAG: hypothetical protein RSH78_00250 [Bacilli bacterium]|uniref:hypothetical protein n=1 Tax=Clostridium sp. TaxID=1506 RepID=UPI002FCB6F30